MDSLSIETGGKRERQKQERERRILAAARNLFDRKGYAGTAMEDIARRAGLAVGTLYNYFPSKDDLLIAIMRRDSDRVVALGQRILADPPTSPAESVLAMATPLWRASPRKKADALREVFAASIASPDTLGARLFALDERMIAPVRGLGRSSERGCSRRKSFRRGGSLLRHLPHLV